MSIEPTPYEQYFLELVNRSRLNPEEEASRYNIDLNEGLDNETISATPKQPLASNPSLLVAARDHSQWMLDTNTFSHTGVNGSDPVERAENAGYPSQFVGENLGWRGSNQIDNLTSFIDSLHEGLFLSPGHRNNLMLTDYQEVGIGLETGGFVDSEGENGAEELETLMATHKFGATLDDRNFFITGVVYEDTNNNQFYDPEEGLAEIAIDITSLNDDFSASTTTMTAGGYQVEVPSGEYEVEFTGSDLENPITEMVRIEDGNVKVDARISLTNDNGESNELRELTLDQDPLRFQTPLSEYRDGVEDTDWVRANPEQVDLGNDLITDSITFTNSGEAELTLQAIQLPDIDGLTQETPFDGDEILAPGESQTYTFGFNPVEADINLEEEQITVFTDDPDQGEINISLLGRATYPADISYEGRINLNDLGRLAASFGSREGNEHYDPSADINFDRQIDATDLTLLNAELGSLF